MNSASSSCSILSAAVAAISITLIYTASTVDGISGLAVIDAPLLTQKIGTNRTIKVDINGNGDFTSVQAAIDSVPKGNNEWIIVHIRKGVYREKVHIPKDKPYIFMRGNGRGRSIIAWSQSSVDNVESATLRVEAPYFTAFGVSFKNDAPTGVAYTSQNQSVAAFVAADKVAFYHCAFYSTHNTLFDYKGRHFYESCYIQGSVDFIFGRGRSVFQSCEIFVIDDKRLKIHGSITAQNRESDGDKSGFVFLKGKVYGTSDVYLGRAKDNDGFVIAVDSNIYQAEFHCHGPGYDPSNRAPWVKQLTEEEAAPFMSIDFIDGASWLPAWL
ncbi:hypothetical protein SAY87_023770 [Trapa incisa]|uniref:Pectinesterase n=1 Tax=Trapa incisa TaxID=236973 RepID=A0AAN7L173_9MYRT|nr:hypothetical protein SAY87_023770 [Trapa incisa]